MSMHLQCNCLCYIRDKDKDLKLNAEEVKDWIIPPDYDHTDAETKHLIFEADANKVARHERSPRNSTLA